MKGVQKNVNKKYNSLQTHSFFHLIFKFHIIKSLDKENVMEIFLDYFLN